MDRQTRLSIARARLVRILSKHTVSSARTLEQKISDAGPLHQRIDPHVLTEARVQLETDGTIIKLQRSIPWYHLSKTSQLDIQAKLSRIEPIQTALTQQSFTMRLGQTLELSVFKTLRQQSRLHFLGGFPDLDTHDDSSLYKKEEPPSSLDGTSLPLNRKFDFVIPSDSSGYAGVEVKNVREWIYPREREFLEFLDKCCSVNAIPILIARRIPYVTFKLLNACGGLVHQTYNQRFPAADKALAAQAAQKDLLGYHDIRVGNDPDQRLKSFFEKVPRLLASARARFDENKSLVQEYATGQIPYPQFAKELLHGPDGPRDHGDDYP
jgi:hypothetical protein